MHCCILSAEIQSCQQRCLFLMTANPGKELIMAFIVLGDDVVAVVEQVLAEGSAIDAKHVGKFGLVSPGDGEKVFYF